MTIITRVGGYASALALALAAIAPAFAQDDAAKSVRAAAVASTEDSAADVQNDVVVSEIRGHVMAQGRNAARTHQVSLQAGKRYKISVKSDDLDPKAELSFNGDTLAEDDDGGEGNNSLIEFTAQRTGIYTIKVGKVGQEGGDYVLSIRELPPLPAPVRPTAKSTSNIVLSRYVGRITPDSPTISGKPLQDFLFSFEADKRVIIFLDRRAGEIDPVLEVYFASDPSGPPIAANDDGGGERNAMLAFIPPETGDYIVRATSANHGVGTITLDVGKSN